MPFLRRLALLFCLALIPHEGSHACAPRIPQPPTGYPVDGRERYDVGDVAQYRGAARYAIGDFAAAWALNRDESLLIGSEGEDPLANYGKPPDSLRDLLDLVGREGDAASLVKELGMRRIRRIPDGPKQLAALLVDPKEPAEVRACAAYALGELRAAPMIPVLQSTLKDPDPSIRGFAALALGRMGDPAAFAAILPMALDDDEALDLRGIAILSLAPAREDKIRSALSRLAARDPDTSVRRAALIALGMEASEKEAGVIRKACTDEDPYVQAAAVLALGRASPGDPLILQALDGKRKEVVRSHAALALGISPAREADCIPALKEVLARDPSDGARSAAALSLGRLSRTDPEGLPPLRLLLEGAPGPVRSYAALGLGASRRKEAIPILAAGLGKEADLAAPCAIALAMLRLPEASEPLLEAYPQARQDARAFIRMALGCLRSPAAYDLLVEGLRDPQGPDAAAVSLMLYGDPRACPALAQAGKGMATCLAFDYLNPEPGKPLTVIALKHQGEKRKAGPRELMRLLNRTMPEDFKIPLVP